MNKRFRFINKPALGAALATVAGVASAATGPDFTTLTGGIVLTGVAAAILAVAGLKVVPIVAGWGARKILAFINRG